MEMKMQNSDPDEFLKHHRLRSFSSDDVNSACGYIFYIAFDTPVDPFSNHHHLPCGIIIQRPIRTTAE